MKDIFGGYWAIYMVSSCVRKKTMDVLVLSRTYSSLINCWTRLCVYNSSSTSPVFIQHAEIHFSCLSFKNFIDFNFCYCISEIVHTARASLSDSIVQSTYKRRWRRALTCSEEKNSMVIVMNTSSGLNPARPLHTRRTAGTPSHLTSYVERGSRNIDNTKWSRFYGFKVVLWYPSCWNNIGNMQRETLLHSRCSGIILQLDCT